MKYFDMTIPNDKFSIDNQPTRVTPRTFDGKEASDGFKLDEIRFTHPATGKVSHERSASIETFGFNGTAILTPSAFNEDSTLDVHDIDDENLEGSLLVLELKKGVAYGEDELKELLIRGGVLTEQGIRNVNPLKLFIVLFKTGLMDQILEITDENGVPDYRKLKEIQEHRPGITHMGARYLSDMDIAKAYAIDNISFETKDGSANGFAATQILMGSTTYFKPLVYHVARTTKAEFECHFKDSSYTYARIGLGNIPAYRPLPGYPVQFKVEDIDLRIRKIRNLDYFRH